MRIAALYDIHGNLPALEAVLADVRQAGADAIVVGGDVLPGPMPRETLDLLLNCGLPAQFIYGNGEVAVLDRIAGRESPKVPPPYQPMMRWVAEAVGGVQASEPVPDYQRVIAAWPMTLRLEVEGLGTVLFCHATPRNEDDIFTRLTPEERLRPVFDAADARAVVCGHTHLQFDRMIGQTRVVNAGSVGLPFGAQGACWLLLGPGLELRRTSYDVQQAVALMRGTGCPNVEEFFVRMLLQPPSEAQMLEMYTPVELA